jgi:ubiquitin-protein ligase E3 C
VALVGPVPLSTAPGLTIVPRTSDLRALDADLARNLAFLRVAEDVTELGLSFTVIDDYMGRQTEVELVPNGAEVPVTNDNR